MTDADKPKFGALLAGVMDLYGKVLAVPTVGIWWGALARFEWADVERAFGLYVQDPDQGRYPPTPAGVIAQIEVSGLQAGQAAFDRLVAAIRSVGPYESVVFDDPLIHAVVDALGGWIHICSSWTTEDLKFREREFGTRYQAALKAERVPYPGKLIGLAEAHNQQAGHIKYIPRPILIGDAAKAEEVFALGTEGGLALTRQGAKPAGLRHLSLVVSEPHQDAPGE